MQRCRVFPCGWVGNLSQYDSVSTRVEFRSSNLRGFVASARFFRREGGWVGEHHGREAISVYALFNMDKWRPSQGFVIGTWFRKENRVLRVANAGCANVFFIVNIERAVWDIELVVIRDVFQFTKEFWSLKRCLPDHPVHYYYSCRLRIV